MEMKKIAGTILLIISVFTAYAQSSTLRGTVVDQDGEPITFVKVILQGPEHIGALTDENGKFSIPLPDTSKQNILEFSFPDYETLQYTVRTNENDIRIKMAGHATPISDIVVVSESRSSKSFSSLSISDSRTLSSPADFRSSSPANGKATAVDNKIKSGTLTAGEVNDFAKWQLWRPILTSEFSSHAATWGFQPKHRYLAQLTNLQGMPIQNAHVTLKHHQEIVWQAKTDNTGKAELVSSTTNQWTFQSKLGI